MKKKIYLICDRRNNSLAQELLQGNTYYIVNMRNLAIRYNRERSLIIALIDDEPSDHLLRELQYAMELGLYSDKAMVIPIIINGAPVPYCIENILHLTIDAFSSDDKKRLRNELARYIQIRSERRDSNYNIDRRNELSRELTTITLGAALFTMVIIVLATVKENMFHQDQFVFIFSLLIAITMSLMAATYTSFQNKRRKLEHEKEQEMYFRRLSYAMLYEGNGNLSNNGGPKTKIEVDAIGRMLINLEDIKEFYTWSQKQAKAAFALAVIMCCLGFGLIACGIFISMTGIFPIKLSIMTGIGGVIVEIVAGTALVVYKSSLLQLNHYHQALHEDERFLSSATLIDRFSNNECRDEMLKEIIRSEIQMNLKTLQYIYPSEEDVSISKLEN